MLQSWLFWDNNTLWPLDGRSHTGYFTFHNPAIVAAVNISMCKNVHKTVQDTWLYTELGHMETTFL